MVEQLVTGDYATIGVYFVVVLSVGLWSACRPNRGSAAGYFLAGKNMHWIPIGASIYASTVGAPSFIGLAGTAAANGFSVAIYEWHAIYFLILLGWVFVPVYIACGAYTMPEYLKKRLGGRRIRLYSSVLSLVEYITHTIAAEIYSGGIFMQQLLGWNIYLCVFIILASTAVYTIADRFLSFSSGGLTSVIYTDTLQAVVMLGGAVTLTSLALIEVGGWDGMITRYPTAATNYTLANQSFYACGMPREDSFHIWRDATMALIEVGGWDGMITRYPTAATNYTLANQTFYACGMPREDSFHIWRDATTGDVPWPGAVFGLSALGLFTWCQDQVTVQRCLSAKSMGHAKAGSLLAAFLKLFSFLIFLVPGMISRILYTDDIACADPKKCYEFCQNEAGCSNLAYPLLVLRLLPSGVRGLMLAAMLAALMSSLTSVFNSASSIVTLDIWTQIRKKAKPREAELMIVGRVTILILVGVSILWLPILQQSAGGILWFYLQAVKAYLVVPWCMLFLLGFFWKRLTEQGAFWGLMAGLVTGLIRMGLDFAIAAPKCGSGEEDRRFAVVAKVDFLHFAIILAGVTTIVMVVVSLLTEPRSDKQLHRVTYWTRHDTLEPELTDDEDEIATPENSFQVAEPEKAPDNGRNWSRLFKNWLCGTTDQPQRYISSEEKAEIRRKMTSLAENKTWRRVLNGCAVLIATFTTFLLVYFG